MALTEDQIKTVLPEAEGEKLTGLIELSAKADKALIDRTKGETLASVDQVVENLTGLKRDAGEFTTKYTERVLTNYKAATEKATALELKIGEYEKQIKDGKGDDAIRQKLKDAEALLASTNEKLSKTENEWKDKYTQAEGKLMKMQLDADFAGARQGVEFKETYSKEDIDTLLAAKQTTILAKYKPDVVEGVLVYRDPSKNNEVVLDDKLNPATGAFLLSKEIVPMLKEGRKAEGNGANPTPGKTTGGALRLNATTQVEADRQIEEFVTSQGIDKKKPEYAEMVIKLRKEHNVSALKLQ